MKIENGNIILAYFGYFGSHFEVVTSFNPLYDYNLMNMMQWNHYIKKTYSNLHVFKPLSNFSWIILLLL